MRRFIVTLVLVASACGPEVQKFDAEENSGTSPADAVRTCESDEHCDGGESCEGDMCLPRRCGIAGQRTSRPPLGTRAVLAERADVVASSETEATAVDPNTSQEIWRKHAPGEVLGIALVRLPESAAAAPVFAGRAGVDIPDVDDWDYDAPAGVPIAAVAAGDVAEDGEDDLVILSSDGRFELCSPALARCERASLGDREGIDVAVGDIDGSGAQRAVFLLRSNDASDLVVVDGVGGEGGASVVTEARFEARFDRVAVGDVTGDGIGEILALEDGGWLGLASDRAHVYAATKDFDSPLPTASLPGNSRDIAVADLRGDGDEELVVLSGGGKVNRLSAHAGEWQEQPSIDLPIGDARAIALGLVVLGVAP